MNTETHSPLIPQGSLEQKKNQGRARVKLVISIVLAVHGIALIALLVAGCQKEKEPSQELPSAASQDQNQASANSTTAPPLDNPPTNTPAPDTNTAPAPTAATPTPATPPAPEPTAPAPVPAAGTSDYKVAAGDTFSTIAKKNHVTVKALMEANPNVAPTKLQIGQTLKVPAPTLAAPTATPTAGAGAEASTSEANTYTVKSGDTLSSIAKNHGVSLRALRSANSLTTDRIKVGDKLKIPAKAATTTAATNPPTQ